MAEVRAAAGQDEALRRMERAAEYNRWLVARATPHLGSRVLVLLDNARSDFRDPDLRRRWGMRRKALRAKALSE